jgi:hypothetical protein
MKPIIDLVSMSKKPIIHLSTLLAGGGVPPHLNNNNLYPSSAPVPVPPMVPSTPIMGFPPLPLPPSQNPMMMAMLPPPHFPVQMPQGVSFAVPLPLGQPPFPTAGVPPPYGNQLAAAPAANFPSAAPSNSLLSTYAYPPAL